MKKLLLFFALVSSIGSRSQEVKREVYADSVLGWNKVNTFGSVKKPIIRDKHVYSIAQQSVGDSLIQWIKASYRPIGALGIIYWVLNEKESPYNTSSRAVPHFYGARAKMFFNLKMDGKGKYTFYDASGWSWWIIANGTLGEPLSNLCTPDKYYFFIPRFGESYSSYDNGEFEKKAKENLNLSGHPSIKNFTWWFEPYGHGQSHQLVVLLAKDNQLPYVQVTKGEYIDQVAAAVDKKFAEEKAKTISSWPEGNARNSVLQNVEEKNQKRLKLLKEQRELYKDRLQEKAFISTESPDALLENIQDVFDGSGSPGAAKIPVYRFDQQKVALCKTDQPQWIVVKWEIDPNYDMDPAQNSYLYSSMKHAHEGMLAHFNFDFMYNYFFYPEKVKGKFYQPIK